MTDYDYDYDARCSADRLEDRYSAMADDAHRAFIDWCDDNGFDPDDPDAITEYRYVD